MPALSPTELFWEFLRYRDQARDTALLGHWLQQQVASCVFPMLSHLPFEAATYTRTRIAQEIPGNPHQFEALIIRWDQQAITPIHGHPAFSFYYVISGVFEMEQFAEGPQGLQLERSQRFYANDMIWFGGKAGRYDNFIHRVTCLQPGLTFHIYSEDAQKGTPYESIKIKIFSGR